MTPPMDSPATTTLDLTPPARAAQANAEGRFIYIAVPWTPLGGGMYKVADYLIQAQQEGRKARCCGRWTRAAAAAPWPRWCRCMLAVGQLARARISGRLAGVHVNMAERLDFVRKSIVR